ncbi:Protein FAM83E [Bagarius yarrelli]|uniref:Protein FAM83E n=1 Tax=Bagarius yarrelli TaxID=175774 RepID=A0A556V4I2_BAGYA|nr:Protein FAM83E [Bagarius yarrelli]
MSRYQEQSLNDEAIFLPAKDTNPEFLYLEAERCALDSLLKDGPDAFYAKLRAQRLEPFLSPEEVKKVSSWVEDHHLEVVNNGDVESEDSSGAQEASDQYFPALSDSPAPCLELGWPQKDRWDSVERVMIYSNPPSEQAPHVREVIRRLLQGATMLIAIVADRLTDSTVIGDLHLAASRGVVVYIILNRRAAEENLTPNQLKHPNITVRILGGKTFMTGDMKKVEGELKENFILVDLETVVLGSYSLTWIDAHLHRQLVTVLSGPAIELFDREFRILYAASLPVPDSWKAANLKEVPEIDETPHQEELNPYKKVLQDCPPSPPPAPEDSPIDWQTLGVFPKTLDTSEDQDLPEISEEPRKFYKPEPDWIFGAGVTDLHINEWQDESMNTQKPDRFQYSFLTERKEGPPSFRHRDFWMERKLMEDMGPFSCAYRLDSLDRSLGENSIPEETITGLAAAPIHHKLYDNFPITPALALMKKRNNEIKSSFLRNFQPLSRPRSFSLGFKKSPFLRETNNDEDQECNSSTRRSYLMD